MLRYKGLHREDGVDEDLSHKDDDEAGFEDGNPVGDVTGSPEPGAKPFSVQRPLAHRKGAIVLPL